jgi:hypothetical protein
MAMTEIQLATLSQQYTNLLQPVIQQQDNRTAKSTTWKTDCKGEDIQIIDYIDKVVPREITDLITIRDTVYDTVNADTRWLPRPSKLEHAFIRNKESDLLRLVDMQSGVRTAQAYAFKVALDKKFVIAALGNAITSIQNNAAGTPPNIVSPYSTVALPADHQLTASATDTVSGLMKDVLALFEATDVDLSANPVEVYLGSSVARVLRDDPEYIEWMTAGMQVLRTNELKDFLSMHFTLLSDTDVWTATSNVDKALFIAGKPIVTGIWSDLQTTIDRMPNKSNAFQIYTCMSSASTRIDEKRVVSVDFSAIV